MGMGLERKRHKQKIDKKGTFATISLFELYSSF